jgi:hypothetical protein
VWAAVSEALRQPEVLAEEYRRRLSDSGSADDIEFEKKQVATALKRVKAREDRVTDAYINEVMELERYRTQMERLKAEREELERIGSDLDKRASEQEQSRGAIEQLEGFCSQVAQGLDNLTFEEKQQLLRLVVERITVDDGKVTIETVIPNGQGDITLRNRCQDRPGQEGGGLGLSRTRDKPSAPTPSRGTPLFENRIKRPRGKARAKHLFWLIRAEAPGPDDTPRI